MGPQGVEICEEEEAERVCMDAETAGLGVEKGMAKEEGESEVSAASEGADHEMSLRLLHPRRTGDDEKNYLCC